MQYKFMVESFNNFSCTLYSQAQVISHIHVHYILYHVIENTTNQNTGKPLYIRRYTTQSSHRALRSYSRRNLVWNSLIESRKFAEHCEVLKAKRKELKEKEKAETHFN